MKILVVSHKRFDTSILPKGYYPIKVGSGLSDDEAVSLGFLRDNAGQNISSKNPFYCELTAQYWAWKNLKNTDIIGLSHYRRYFADYKFFSNNMKDFIVKENKVRSILQRHKIIIPYRTKKSHGAMLYKDRPRDEQEQYWLTLQDIIYADYPEMKGAFDSVLTGRTTIYLNMMITTKKIFDEYSEWIFDVLDKFDQRTENGGGKRIPRVDGYLSETLLDVWVSYRFKESEIYHMEVFNTELSEVQTKKFLLLSKFKTNHVVQTFIMNLWLRWKLIKEKWIKY